MAVPIFFVLAATMVVLTFLPVFRPHRPLVETGEDMRQGIRALEQEKTSYLRAIQDVEFERKIGKVSEGDHAELREHYMRKVAETLKALELLRCEQDRERSRT